jgi:hypothetical protein
MMLQCCILVAAGAPCSKPELAVAVHTVKLALLRNVGKLLKIEPVLTQIILNASRGIPSCNNCILA